MGFFSDSNKSQDSGSSGCEYKVAGYAIACPVCKGAVFTEGEALLDDSVSSILGVEAFGASATILTCTTCGHVEWFAKRDLVEKW